MQNGLNFQVIGDLLVVKSIYLQAILYNYMRKQIFQFNGQPM